MNIGIIGTGLIGGSLGLALRGKKYRVFCYNRRVEVSKKAVKIGAAEKYFETIEDLTENSDVIIIATPLGSYHTMLKEISKKMTAEKIISDVGSVKRDSLKKEMKEKDFPKRFHKNFITAHPIAGSEKAGIENAFAGMFKGKRIIITRKSKTLEKIWKDAGGKIEIMSADKHNEIYAYVSHYVQFLSFVLTKIIKGNLGEFNRLMRSPRGFWDEVFAINKKNLASVNKKFMKQLAVNSKTAKGENADHALALLAAQTLADIVPAKYKQYAGSGYKSFTSIAKNSKKKPGGKFKTNLKKFENELKKFK